MNNDRPMKGLLGGHLRRLRKERGMSQRQVAEALGISHVFVGEMERGERGLPWARREQLAEMYETSDKCLRVLDVLDRQDLLNLRPVSHMERRIAIWMVGGELGLSLEEERALYACVEEWAAQGRM